MMNKEKEVVSMHNVINDYWNHYNEMKSKDELREKEARIIAENSVPIIWHGRLVDYYKSKVRIITVSQNPHHRAFGDTPHFDMEKVRGISNHKELDQKSMSILTNQFDAYFERNKENSINDSVFSVYEKMINEVNGSYFKNEDFENCALHLDMLSPIATNPVWSKLDTKQKLVLEKSGKKLFEDLLKVLKL